VLALLWLVVCCRGWTERAGKIFTWVLVLLWSDLPGWRAMVLWVEGMDGDGVFKSQRHMGIAPPAALCRSDYLWVVLPII
jgi:hypothetical protein